MYVKWVKSYGDFVKFFEFWRPSWILGLFSCFWSFRLVWQICKWFYMISRPNKHIKRPQDRDCTSNNDRYIGFGSFCGGHFEKWPPRVVSPNFFSGNMAKILSRGPLKKMVPLAEDHGGMQGDPLYMTDYKG